MSKYRTFAPNQPLPADFVNALQEFISNGVFNLQLQQLSNTVVRIPAGPGNGKVAVGINSGADGVAGWRWREANLDISHPNGSAGQYDIFVTAPTPNAWHTTGSGEVDDTNYVFNGVILPQGQTPTGVAAYRKIGESTWDGSVIRLAVLTVGGGGGAPADGPPDKSTMRSLGTGSRQAVAGDDARLPSQAENDALQAIAGVSPAPGNANRFVTNQDPRNNDARVPKGAAGGDLNGNFPNPGVAKINGRAVNLVVFNDDARLADARMPRDNSVTLDSLTAEVKRQLAPVGEVIEWFKPADSVPEPDGWEICDGRQIPAGSHDYGTGQPFNTPDLRHKFIVGADPSKPVGTSGGSADGNANLPGTAPGIGAAGGTNIVDLQHTHVVYSHSHGISPDGAHTHVVHHQHRVELHSHHVMSNIAKSSGAGDDSPATLWLIDPSDAREKRDGTGSGVLDQSGSGNRYAIGLRGGNVQQGMGGGSGVVPTYITSASGGTGLELYEQTTDDSQPFTDFRDPVTSQQNPGSHSHGGQTQGTVGNQSGSSTQLSATTENRPSYVGLLRLLKVRWA